MKTKLFYLITTILATSVCINAQVKSDYDKSVDFSQYKSVSFAGWEKESDKILNDFDKKRILEAFKAEFLARGIDVKMMDGDAQVTLFLVVENKTSTTAYTDYTGGYGYGPSWGWGMGAGMGASTTTYVEDDYMEGTLVVDIYDSKSKAMVWQGVINTEVKENPAKREKTIPKNVRKLMKGYPVNPTK